MITLTTEQLHALLYRAKTDAVENYRSVYRNGDNISTWIDSAQFYRGLHDEAGRMATNAKCEPIDLDRIASVI